MPVPTSGYHYGVDNNCFMGLFVLYTSNFLDFGISTCKTAGHGPCQFWWGIGVGNHSHFWSKTVFSAQTTFTTFITGPLCYRMGNYLIVAKKHELLGGLLSEYVGNFLPRQMVVYFAERKLHFKRNIIGHCQRHFL